MVRKSPYEQLIRAGILRIGRKRLKARNRNPNVRRELRQVMMERLAAEVKAREVKELADKIGIGKTKQRRKKVV